MYASWWVSSVAPESEVPLKRRIVPPRILIPSLQAVYIFMVTGMRSLARIPRRRTDFILARQPLQPVSAMTDARIDLWVKVGFVSLQGML